MAAYDKELTLYRRLLGFAGGFYLCWWFAVEWFLPGSFNPFLTRFCVVAFVFVALGMSYLHILARQYIRFLFICSVWLITAHYYYLFYMNSSDADWVVGSFITVTAISLGLLSARSLFLYSIFASSLSLWIFLSKPGTRHSLLLPGIITILFQANAGLQSRLRLIKGLGASNERFQLLFNSTFEGIAVHQDNRIAAVNDSFIEIFGYPRDELIGHDVMSLIYEDDREIVAINMQLKDIPPYAVRGLRKDGSTVRIELRGKTFVYEGRPARLVTVQNIEDRLRADEERVKLLTMRENVRVRDEFISIASHELKTPLSSLRLQAQIIARDMQTGRLRVEPREKLQDAVGVFTRQARRLTEMVESMLDVSRISTNRFLISPKRMDFAQHVRDILATMRLQVEGVQELPEIRYKAPEQLFVIADPARTDQVIENLVTNAIKYGEGKPIDIVMRSEGREAILVVEDHGMGIPSEFKSRIFNRFERAVPARQISGLGLGLYITRNIIDAHGGKIDVESEPGRGSTFTVTLPLDAAAEF